MWGCKTGKCDYICSRARLYSELDNFHRIEMSTSTIVDNEGEHLTVGEIVEIKAQVVKLVNKYYSTKDNTLIPKEIMNIPYTFMGTPTTPPFVATDPEKVVEQYNRYNKSVLEAEPDKHEAIYTPNNVCVLSRTSAIISGNNTHLRADGSAISVHGVVYVLSKFEDKGWRIVAFAPTATDTVIRKTSE